MYIAEIWKFIPKYENQYEVSNYGRIRCIQTGKIRKSSVRSNGYKSIFLYKKQYQIHRLVLCVFTNMPLSYFKDVHHRNNDKLDNKLKNLVWVTRSQNVRYAYRDKLRMPVNLIGNKNGRSKLTEKDVIAIRKMSGKYSNVKIASIFQVSPANIGRIIKRQTWAHV